MCGRRLAQWHVLQPKMAAPGQLLDAQTPWCGALQSDSPWSSHSDVSGLEDCRPQTCDLHPRIAETQRGGASQGPRGGGFRCTGACVERRPKARQFNDILHSNMLKKPTGRTFDLRCRSIDLEFPSGQPTTAAGRRNTAKRPSGLRSTALSDLLPSLVRFWAMKSAIWGVQTGG